MLILRRKEGQWVEITHRSGDTIRIRVCNIRAQYPGQLDMVLDDPDHHFVIQRAERGARNRDSVPETGGQVRPGSGGMLPIAVPQSGGRPTGGTPNPGLAARVSSLTA